MTRLTPAEKKLAAAIESGATINRDRKSILVCDIPGGYIARASTWESLCAKRRDLVFMAKDNDGLKGVERRKSA